ncbi:hypothetical protein UZ35_13215 [Heyndrickxia coagulans]|nr:hypothetical protein UZ35_13215 [Heyndrickxia coagulans]
MQHRRRNENHQVQIYRIEKDSRAYACARESFFDFMSASIFRYAAKPGQQCFCGAHKPLFFYF